MLIPFNDLFIFFQEIVSEKLSSTHTNRLFGGVGAVMLNGVGEGAGSPRKFSKQTTLLRNVKNNPYVMKKCTKNMKFYVSTYFIHLFIMSKRTEPFEYEIRYNKTNAAATAVETRVDRFLIHRTVCIYIKQAHLIFHTVYYIKYFTF